MEKKIAQRYRRFVGVFSRKIRNTARLAFHLWYDMIWYDCIPHVSVQVCSVSGWKMHKRWQYPARNLSSGCNYSYEKLVAKYNFSDPFQTLASHHPNHPRAQRSQSRNATEIPHIPGAITFKPWLSSCRSNSSRSKPRGLPPFCGSWIREIVHFPLWDYAILHQTSKIIEHPLERDWLCSHVLIHALWLSLIHGLVNGNSLVRRMPLHLPAGIFTSKWCRNDRSWLCRHNHREPWSSSAILMRITTPAPAKKESKAPSLNIGFSPPEACGLIMTYWQSRKKKGTETLCLKTPSDFGLLPLFSPEFLDVCSLPKCTGLGFGKLIWGMKSMLPRRCWFAMHGTRFATCHPFLSMSTIGKCVLST